MRWMNVRRVRKVLKSGAATYESADLIMKRKSMDMVHYLRARRSYGTDQRFNGIYLRNLRFSRGQHLNRKRMGLRPYRLIR